MSRIYWSVSIFILGVGAFVVYVLFKSGSGKLSGDLMEYQVRGIPFCPKKTEAEKPNYFRQKHILLVKSDTSYSRSPLSGDVASDFPIRKLIDSEAIFILLSCKAVNGRFWIKSGDYKAINDSRVPKVCSGQKTVFHKRLKAVETKDSEAKGFSGVFELPDITILCQRGESIRTEGYNLSQLADGFEDSAMAYLKRYEKFPSSVRELETKAGLSPLPPDPWGTAFYVDNKENNCRLMSAGEDKKPGTTDDREIRKMKRRLALDEAQSVKSGVSSSSHKLKRKVPEKLIIPLYSDYQEFLKSRGIK